MPDNRNAMQVAASKGVTPAGGGRKFFPIKDYCANASLHKIAEMHDNVRVIKVHELYSRDGESLLIDGTECVYVDDDHLTSYGAKLALPRFEQAILSELNRPQIIATRPDATPVRH